MTQEDKNTFSSRRKLVAIALMVVAGLCPAMLVSSTSLTPMTDGFLYFAVYAVALFTVTTMVTRRHEKDALALNREIKGVITNMVGTYNQQVVELKQQYKEERQQTGKWALTGSTKLRTKYSGKYDDVRRDFQQLKKTYLEVRQKDREPFRQMRSLWGWSFVIVLGAIAVTFISSAPPDDTPAPTALSQQEEETTYWNAENIPIPYLQDATQYVSNPDHVLSDPAVAHINATMKRLEDSLDIQSVVIVVNHIENDDPFRMAQDVGNRYGVGRKDRGLVMICGYLDHSINISPGRSLEADLTDAECRRLQQAYVIPAMKAEQPDSAMVLIADAIYATLSHKQLPEPSSLLSKAEQQEDDLSTAMALYSCFLAALLILFVYKNKTYQWMGGIAAMSIMANPFIDYGNSSGFSSGYGHTSGGGFGGGGFGGGGFGGGSFGGGSFGGGGATSRW